MNKTSRIDDLSDMFPITIWIPLDAKDMESYITGDGGNLYKVSIDPEEMVRRKKAYTDVFNGNNARPGYMPCGSDCDFDDFDDDDHDEDEHDFCDVMALVNDVVGDVCDRLAQTLGDMANEFWIKSTDECG